MWTSLSKRCRLCATLSESLQSLEAEMIRRIGSLFQVEIGQDTNDSLPKNICTNCLFNVNNTWLFYETVQQAQRKLFDLNVRIHIKNEEDHNSVESLEHADTNFGDTCSSNNLNNYSENIPEIVCVKEIKEDSEKLEEPRTRSKRKIKVNQNDVSKCKIKRRKCLKEEKEDVEEDLDILTLKKRLSQRKVKKKYPKKKKRDKLGPDDTWPDYPWTCAQCGHKSTDLLEYRKHSCFQNEKQYSCVDCHRTYLFLSHFYTHINVQHWQRRLRHLLLQCDVCQSWFDTREAQELHRGESHPQAGPRPPPQRNELECEDCGKVFPNKGQLVIHRAIHTGVKPVSCDECDKTFDSNTALRYHKRTHEGRMDFTCEECGKSFYQKAHLASHMNSHILGARVKCPVCEKTLKSQLILGHHMKQHTMDRQHVCQVCGLKFRLKSHLVYHARKHSEDKPFSCDFCDKRFKLKNVRDVHRRQHTGEQPYCCSVCMRRFTNWANWQKHVKRMHDGAASGTPAKAASADSDGLAYSK